ncbi:MAG: UDP-N-acetylmuramoyl-tripeptide--D-alanyl-D-alanine ligase [bacterium]|nr:UDP-N-acetylmuramoyl-tripeptide--D-alanyl-D-alanine ligase [bacterium]
MTKNILKTVLRWLSILILWKYQPLIIAITGSVGKTAAKEAVFAVASIKARTRKSYGNYNNEIGVPLTIIGCISPGRKFFAWLWIFAKGVFIFLFPAKYPKILVVEMGADRPGDIEYLTSFVKPAVSVVTAVGPSHLENFSKMDHIILEKSNLVRVLRGGTAVLNYDDPAVRQMAAKHKGKTTFYGLDSRADIAASDIIYKPQGIIFKARYSGNTVPIELTGVLGEPSVYAALAAAACGIVLGLNLVEIGRALGIYRTLPGRLRLLSGIKSTTIIDDTYNSSPASAIAALEILSLLPAQRRIAILGDMAELGEATEQGHREVGRAVAERKIDIFVVVGPKSKFSGDEARLAGYAGGQILEFENSDEARIPVQNLIRPGDMILVKGSQAARMEKIVKEIMAEPERAGKLLCRQSGTWLDT